MTRKAGSLSCPPGQHVEFPALCRRRRVSPAPLAAAHRPCRRRRAAVCKKSRVQLRHRSAPLPALNQGDPDALSAIVAASAGWLVRRPVHRDPIAVSIPQRIGGTHLLLLRPTRRPVTPLLVLLRCPLCPADTFDRQATADNSSCARGRRCRLSLPRLTLRAHQGQRGGGCLAVSCLLP